MGAWIRLRTISVRVRIPPDVIFNPAILCYQYVQNYISDFIFSGYACKKRVRAHKLYTQYLFYHVRTVDINIQFNILLLRSANDSHTSTAVGIRLIYSSKIIGAFQRRRVGGFLRVQLTDFIPYWGHNIVKYVIR